MQVNQRLHLWLWLKAGKTNKNGESPIYCKVTIDGREKALSTSRSVHPDHWDQKAQQVKSTHQEHAAINKRLRHVITDLERHFDLITAKKGIARPEDVIESYQTPINGQKEKDDLKEYTNFSLDLDQVIARCFTYFRHKEKADKDARYREVRLGRLTATFETLIADTEKIVNRGNKIFDDKTRKKTIGMAIDEYLLYYLQLVMSGQRAHNTYKKKTGTKRRWLDFLRMRHKTDDLPIESLTVKHLEEFVLCEKTTYQSQHNTIWKYVQILQEFASRANNNGWSAGNPWALYEFQYREPQGKKWPSMAEMIHLINFDFSGYPKRLEVIRDIFVYQSFAAPAYAELEKLDRDSLLKGVDGKLWADQWRKKTGSEETLPLLPICLEIIEKLKDHPKVLRTGKLLPVPSNYYYNKCLRQIGEITGIPCLNNCHQARYFFANEVAYETEKDLRLIGLMLGQRSPNSIHTYIKPKTRHIAASMDKIAETLYQAGGALSATRPGSPDGGAKVIRIGTGTSFVPRKVD